jgi:YfiH family protein
MIRPPGFRGVAFGAAADGDGRGSDDTASAMAGRLGIPAAWAVVRQVHGGRVIRAEAPGRLGAADGLFTTFPMLPLAVGTADCLPVALEADGGAGIAHAGWRGLAAGVVANLRAAMEQAGAVPIRAAVGPGIGPCCYEVGREVVDRFADRVSTTSRGTPAVDLEGVAVDQLDGLEVWTAGVCTSCGSGFHSYRRDGGDERQMSVVWLPSV